MAALTFLCFLSTCLNTNDSKVSINTQKGARFWSRERKKRLRIYYTINQVVLWDKIIQRGESAVLDYRSMNTKYYFHDDGHGLKGHKNVTLSLSWNVIPNAGMLPNIFGTGSHKFEFPVHYATSKF
ncbi:DgyrCDS3436 [Dimorphilus gyrociliatus]|uniref:Signal peptidase complex subunit 3 n=1 Tax=Dimorphilus gyrociliatus TaxID=2664684 RepID=A0A7I8VDR8_9ANNE|nr:DgyrCDS3436 [Dimorphilus gyrociliatus]